MKPEVAAQMAIQNQVGTCRALKVGNAGASYLYSLTYFENGKKKTERFGMPISIQSSPLIQVIQSSYVVPESKLRTIMTQIKNNLLIPSAYAYKAVGSGGVYQKDPILDPIKDPGVDPVKDPKNPGGTPVGTIDWGSAQAIDKIKLDLLPVYQIPDFSSILDAQAKLQLGNRVKSLVQQSKCGNVVFESYRQKLTDMKGKVDFYMKDGKLTCLAGDFVKRVRNPDNCQMKVVKSVLPPAVCNLLYQIEANHSGRTAKQDQPATGGGSASPSSGVGAIGTNPVISLPVLKPLTAAIEEEIAISEVLEHNPEIIAVSEIADTFQAEHMLPVSTLDLLESQTITAASFDTLSSNQKAELVNLVRTHDAIKASNDHVQFSSAVVTTINAIKVKANSYASSQSIGSIYSIPKKSEIALHLDAKLDPLIKIVKKPFKYNLGCAEQAIQIQPKLNTNLAL
jgi:hypothetical protein